LTFEYGRRTILYCVAAKAFIKTSHYSKRRLSAQVRIVILLVEDSEQDAFLFHRAVHKTCLPAVTHVAVDGIEAKDYLLNQGRFADVASNPPPDIMFLDLKMPRCNGFEVLEWMKHAKFRRIPVVVLTSSTQVEDQARVEKLGAALYLAKPVTPEQLRIVFRNVGH
jgi:two-component system, response regulator